MTTGSFSLGAHVLADLRRYRSITAGISVDSPLRLRHRLSVLSPRFLPILLCRVAHKLFTLKLGPLAKVVSLVNFLWFGIEIAVRCPIGKGLFFPHTQGTVIGADSIGENATIYHGVTIGAKELDLGYTHGARPTVGNDVMLGSGAKVLGGIHVGNGVRIGANTVVIESVPDDALVVGAAARILGRSNLTT